LELVAGFACGLFVGSSDKDPNSVRKGRSRLFLDNCDVFRQYLLLQGMKNQGLYGRDLADH
jgi:hypothetical protein